MNLYLLCVEHYVKKQIIVNVLREIRKNNCNVKHQYYWLS